MISTDLSNLLYTLSLSSLVNNPFEQYAHGMMAKYKDFDSSLIGLGLTTKHANIRTRYYNAC